MFHGRCKWHVLLPPVWDGCRKSILEAEQWVQRCSYRSGKGSGTLSQNLIQPFLGHPWTHKYFFLSTLYISAGNNNNRNILPRLLLHVVSWSDTLWTFFEEVKQRWFSQFRYGPYLSSVITWHKDSSVTNPNIVYSQKCFSSLVWIYFK